MIKYFGCQNAIKITVDFFMQTCPFVFFRAWSWGYRGSEASHTPAEEEILGFELLLK